MSHVNTLLSHLNPTFSKTLKMTLAALRNVPNFVGTLFESIPIASGRFGMFSTILRKCYIFVTLARDRCYICYSSLKLATGVYFHHISYSFIPLINFYALTVNFAMSHFDSNFGDSSPGTARAMTIPHDKPMDVHYFLRARHARTLRTYVLTHAVGQTYVRSNFLPYRPFFGCSTMWALFFSTIQPF